MRSSRSSCRLVAGARESDPTRVRAMVAALHGWALVLLVPVTAVDVPGLDLGGAAAAGLRRRMRPRGVRLANDMLWVFLLQIPVYGATVVAQGALQAHQRFFAPAVAPAVSSLVVIASYLVYAAMAGDERGSLVALSDAEFLVLAGGTTLGVVALLAVQVPALVRAGLIVETLASLSRRAFGAGPDVGVERCRGRRGSVGRVRGRDPLEQRLWR